MTFKKTAIILFVIFSILPVHKTYGATNDSIKNIQNIVVEKTPPYISKPILITINGIEKFRIEAGLIVKNKAKKIGQELEVLEATRQSSEPNSTSKKDENKFSRPVKQLEMFFASLLSFTLNNKLIFYSVLAVIIFLSLRYIWWLIFP